MRRSPAFGANWSEGARILKRQLRFIVAITPFLGLVACRGRNSGRSDIAATDVAGNSLLAVTILGDLGDPRIAPAREAITHWNEEFRRLGVRVQLDSVTVRNDSVPDEALRAAGGEVMFGFGPAIASLLAKLATVPGDIVIALSHTDLVSFSVAWRSGSKGVVGVRRSDIPPLSLPNTTRNVVAHELGHVLGLSHNMDSTTLMCGRPTPCRPAVFASDSAFFFPLTPRDEQSLRSRWR